MYISSILKEKRYVVVCVGFIWTYVVLTVSMYGSVYFSSDVDVSCSNSDSSRELSGRGSLVFELRGAAGKHEDPGENTTFQRKEAVPEETEELPFLNNYRNPCWRELDVQKNESRIRCLPYFFLVGAPKCGTTDLAKRLSKHPLISAEVKKELHWLTRRRFHKDSMKMPCFPSQCSASDLGRNQSLTRYLKYFDKAVETDISAKEENGFHPMIFGDCSASVLWDNTCLLCPVKDSITTIPPYTNADVIHKLNPDAKIIIILRHPISRLYSDYLYFRDSGKSVEQFHDGVVDSIKKHESCMKEHSIVYCAYFTEPSLRIQIGFYHVYIEDYLRVFPKEQVKVIKLEDHSQRMYDSMTEVFTFLGIGIPSEEIMAEVVEETRAETKSQGDVKLGDMLPETRELLAEFYKPYNDRLVELLGEEFRYD